MTLDEALAILARAHTDSDPLYGCYAAGTKAILEYMLARGDGKDDVEWVAKRAFRAMLDELEK
jgi:hypothetical protein